MIILTISAQRGEKGAASWYQETKRLRHQSDDRIGWGGIERDWQWSPSSSGHTQQKTVTCGRSCACEDMTYVVWTCAKVLVFSPLSR